MPHERMEADPAFEELIQHIQQTRGLDFRGYKRSSLRRRIQLRMQAVGAEDFAAYQSHLEGNPQEFADLLDTVLINVTSFFRDPDAWKALREQVIPDLARQRDDGRRTIRVWSVGCASGEEPFSVAMLLAEALGVEKFCERVKIYATDLDEGALRAARLATYGPRDVEDLDPALLEKYFEHTAAGYVFQRDLRKSVIFGRHNVVYDAPISRIDLLICRNLMIYLEAETQNLVLPRLHYSLVDDGRLFLGKAETQLARSNLFKPLDMKHRIFAKVANGPRRTVGGSLTGAADGQPSDLHAKVLEAVVDASTVGYLAVNNDGVVVFANAAVRRLLGVRENDVGRLLQDLPISYRPSELRGRIEDVMESGKPIRLEHQEFQRAGEAPLRVSIDITPLLGGDLKPSAALLGFSDTTRLFNLQVELQGAQESLETMIEELQSANEELETTNEELQSTNEELETTNEELQSTNEELETINEELRSTNDEAEAVNDELRRQSDLAAEYRAHSDSILRSIDAGVVVLDDALMVRSWNRWGEKVWGLRAEDVVGRDVLDLDIGLPLARVQDRLRAVASGAQGRNETVLDGADRRGNPLRCRVRMWPLTFPDQSRHGVVLVIEDITAETQRDAYTQHLGRILGRSLNEIYFLDPRTLRFTLVNRGAEQRLGYGIQQLRQMALSDLMPQVQHAALLALAAPLLSGERAEIVIQTVIRSRQGQEYPAEICLQYYGQEDPSFLLAIVQDATERDRTEAE